MQSTANGVNEAKKIIDAQAEHKDGAKAQVSSPDILLYSDLYKNAMMGAESCAKIVGKTAPAEDKQSADGAEDGVEKCEKLRLLVTDMLEGYSGFAKKAKAALQELGAPAEQLSMLERMPAEIGITVQTMFDRSPSKLAELMINGATMGIIDMKKAQRVCSEDGCSPEAYRAASDVISFCEDYVESLKDYL